MRFGLSRIPAGPEERMGKAKFILGRLKSMDYRQMLEVVGKVHERSGKNRLYLFADMIRCGFRYQAGYMDYMNAEMYNMTKEQREDVITRGVSNSYVVRFNDPKFIHYFYNKNEFNEKFAPYIKRDWVLIKGEEDREKFEKFIEGKENFILKPFDGIHGTGVMKLPAVKKVFEQNLDKVPYMAEEIIEQVPEMAALNPSSVNTFRAITVLNKGKATLVAGCLRIGNGGVIDNFCNGGMVTTVNVETGKVEYPAIDEENDVFEVHPLTGTSIVGFQIPMFEEAKQMVLEAAHVVPEVGYVGWDVAISKRGPCLIEGNEYPMYAFFNFPIQHPDGKGMRHVFEAAMK